MFYYRKKKIDNQESLLHILCLKNEVFLKSIYFENEIERKIALLFYLKNFQRLSHNVTVNFSSLKNLFGCSNDL